MPSYNDKDAKYVTGTISAAPDPSEYNIFGRLRESFNRARYNANTPLQAVDIFAKTLRDTSLAHWRSILFTERVDKGITEIPASILKPLAYVASGDWKRPGDRQFSEKLADGVNAYFDSTQSKPDKFGDYDIAMAAGWFPKGKVIVNGVETELKKPIDNLFAVFVRNPDGKIEILDPSIKASSLKEAAVKFPALPLMLDNGYADKKWSQTAGGYMFSQLVPMIATSGFGAALRGTAAVSKASTVNELVSGAAKVQDLNKAFTAAQMGSIAVQLAGTKYQHVVSEGVADKLVASISEIMKDPSKISPTAFVEAMNKGLHQYTFNKGTSNSIYIPSLAEGDAPWQRLEQVLAGRLTGKVKDSSPWDKWKDSRDIRINDIQGKLTTNPEFMSVFLKTAQRGLKGGALSDGDVFALKFGMCAILRNSWELEGKNFDGARIKYSKDDVDDTRLGIKETLTEMFRMRLASNPDSVANIAASLGVDMSRFKKDEKYSFQTILKLGQGLPDAALDQFASLQLKEIQTKIDLDRRSEIELQKAQAQARMFMMH